MRLPRGIDVELKHAGYAVQACEGRRGSGEYQTAPIADRAALPEMPDTNALPTHHGPIGAGENTLTTPFNPETVTNYELGVKSQWLADRLRINASIFRMDYKDKQELFFNPAEDGYTKSASTGT